MPALRLQVARSRSRRFPEVVAIASKSHGFAQSPDGAFSVSIDTSDLADVERVRDVLLIGWTWKGTRVEVDGSSLRAADALDTLDCYVRKRATTSEKQPHYCDLPRHTSADLDETYRTPCHRSHAAPHVVWSHFVRGNGVHEVTDREAMVRALQEGSASFDRRWCPGFDLVPTLVRIRSLPDRRSLQRTLETARWAAVPLFLTRLRQFEERYGAEGEVRLRTLSELLADSEALTAHDLVQAMSDEQLQDLAQLTDIPDLVDLKSVASWDGPRKIMVREVVNALLENLTPVFGDSTGSNVT